MTGRHGCSAALCPNGKCRTTGECQDTKSWDPDLPPPTYCTFDGALYYHGSDRKCSWCPEAPPRIEIPIDAKVIGHGPGQVIYIKGPGQTRLIDTDSSTRKTFPMARGLLDYFPDALAAVANVSQIGNDKHNPGEPMHHARGKSMDHADCIMRHLVGRGGFDGDTRESAALAWRALALLQEELEAEMDLPLPRGARA